MSFLLELDMSVQPYSVGDTIVAIAAANAEAAGSRVDVVLVADPLAEHADENMRELHRWPLESVGRLLSLFELVHGLGSVTVTTDPRPQRGEYQTYMAIRKIAARGARGLLNFSEARNAKADSILASHGPRVVTVNLRSKSHHLHRNANHAAWNEAMDICAAACGIVFLVVGESSEIPDQIPERRHVVFAKKAHGTSLIEDMALVHRSAAHVGSPSGPLSVAMLGTAPYFCAASEHVRPHIAKYCGALTERPDGSMAWSFAAPCQEISPEPESAGLLVRAIRKIARMAWGV